MPRKDSEDEALLQGQRAYFKDSKVRDKGGNLLVAYHDGQAFAEFDLSRAENAG